MATVKTTGTRWFSWFPGYEWSRDNSKEIEKGWIAKGESANRRVQRGCYEAPRVAPLALAKNNQFLFS